MSDSKFADALDRIVTEPELRRELDRAPIQALADLGINLTEEQRRDIAARSNKPSPHQVVAPPYVPIAGVAPAYVPIAGVAPPYVPIAGVAPPYVPIAGVAPPYVPIAGVAPPYVPIAAFDPPLRDADQ
jgi:hypothetical protein